MRLGEGWFGMHDPRLIDNRHRYRHPSFVGYVSGCVWHQPCRHDAEQKKIRWNRREVISTVMRLIGGEGCDFFASAPPRCDIWLVRSIVYDASECATIA